MSRARRSLSLLALLALGVGACEESSVEPEPDPDPGTTEAGPVALRLDHLVNGTPLFPGAPCYATANGDSFSIERLAYVVSGIELVREDGLRVGRPDPHARIALDDDHATLTLDDVPPGRYVGLSLTVGLPEAQNVWGELGDDPALDPLRWPDPLGGGYYFLRIDGAVAGDGEATPFRVGLGTIDDGGTASPGQVRIDVPGFEAEVRPIHTSTGSSAHTPTVIGITMDVGAWLDDPVYDLATEAGEAERTSQAILLANGPDVYVRPAPVPVEIEVPARFPPPVSTDNPPTDAGVRLGRFLFHDPILSGDGTLSCAGCHQPARGFADETALSEGIDGSLGDRNAPALSNLAFQGMFFWDGRAPSLEAQAIEPVQNPIEMHLPWPEAEVRLADHRFYPSMFERAFGTREITRDRAVAAIAMFERTLISAGSRYDREFQTGGFTAQEMEGFNLFTNEVGDCFHCHFVTPLFTDNRFHNVGLDSVLIDRGLGEITGDPRDMGLFKTPSLRNVEHTAPYMHDGRFETLTEVVQHYNSGGFRTPTVDPLIRVGEGLQLSDDQVAALVAFLKTLSDPEYLTNPAYRSPFPAPTR